jgi:predicted CopG family antitoxin
MSSKTLKMIAVSEENYLVLKRLGSAGDSFNDVVTGVLKKIKEPLQTDIGVGA